MANSHILGKVAPLWNAKDECRYDEHGYEWSETTAPKIDVRRFAVYSESGCAIANIDIKSPFDEDEAEKVLGWTKRFIHEVLPLCKNWKDDNNLVTINCEKGTVEIVSYPSFGNTVSFSLGEKKSAAWIDEQLAKALKGRGDAAEENPSIEEKKPNSEPEAPIFEKLSFLAKEGDAYYDKMRLKWSDHYARGLHPLENGSYTWHNIWRVLASLDGFPYLRMTSSWEGDSKEPVLDRSQKECYEKAFSILESIVDGCLYWKWGAEYAVVVDLDEAKVSVVYAPSEGQVFDDMIMETLATFSIDEEVPIDFIDAAIYGHQANDYPTTAFLTNRVSTDFQNVLVTIDTTNIKTLFGLDVVNKASAEVTVEHLDGSRTIYEGHPTQMFAFHRGIKQALMGI